MIKTIDILKFCIIGLFVIYANLSAQIDDQILVKLNGENIMQSEFKNRLDFSPKEGLQSKSNSEGIKKELLYTMIAERLWALEAIEKGYENHSSVITAKNSIEKMFVRDALYKSEIKDKINITNEDIETGLKLYSVVISADVFFSEDENEVLKIHSLLKKNTSVNLIINNLDTLKVITKKVPISFGDLDPLTENSIFNLKPNQFSDPIKFSNGWRIFYINEIINRKEYDKNNISDSYKSVVKILKERQENSNYEIFYKKFFADKKVHVDGKLFDLLTGKLHEIFVNKANDKLLSVDENGNKRFLFDSYDVRKTEDEIKKDLLNENFIEFDSNPVSLRTFIRDISFSSFSVTSEETDSIKNSLDKKIKEFIKYELLAREGYRKGLNNLPEVRKWVDVWNKSFLYQSIRNDFFSNEIDASGNYSNEEDNNGKRAFKSFIDSTIQLAKKYNFNVNEVLFSKITQGNINLFVVRHLGFGGSITGVPTSYPFIEWYLELQKRKEENNGNIL